MNQPINILCCTDEKYAPFYGIMLTSLFDNNKEEFFEIFVLTAGLKEETTQDLQTLVDANHSKLTVIIIDESRLKNCPIREGDHVTLATYYRLLTPVLLPDVERIIYLDGDIIINKSLKPLWNTNLEDKALAAIIDEDYNGEERHKRLYIPQQIPYFNAGVLLINLKYWREHDVISRCMKCIENMADKLLFHDQDTLNVVLHNEIKLLPLTYNFQRGFIDYAFYNNYDSKYQEEINGVKYKPTVIHYTGYSKPWHEGCRHPYTSYFLYYWKKSFWHGMPLVKTHSSFKQRLSAIRNEIIWALGIKKRPRTYLIERQNK
jgi:lipopolysaccharide biosynthesis glycosyltransferase